MVKVEKICFCVFHFRLCAKVHRRRGKIRRHPAPVRHFAAASPQQAGKQKNFKSQVYVHRDKMPETAGHKDEPD